MYVKTIRGQALGLAKFPPECKQPQGRRGASAGGWERILERRERRRRRRRVVGHSASAREWRDCGTRMTRHGREGRIAAQSESWRKKTIN